MQRGTDERNRTRNWERYWRERAVSAERRARKFEMTARARWQDLDRMRWLETRLRRVTEQAEGRKHGLVDIATGDYRQSIEGRSAEWYAAFVLMLYEDGE